MKEKACNLLFFLLLMKSIAISQTYTELPLNTDLTYHDSIYYLIKGRISNNEWNLSGIEEEKNFSAKSLFDANFASQFIASNHIVQVGDSISKLLETKTVTYAEMAAYKTEIFSMKKVGEGNLYLANRNIASANCYAVLSKNDYQLLSNSSIIFTDKINAFYFTDSSDVPVAWFVESNLSSGTSGIYNYISEFVNHGFANDKINTDYANLAELVNLTCSPNPAYTSTTVSYTLPYSASVELSIKNINNTTSTLLEEINYKTPGGYSYILPLVGYTPGIYTIQLSINSIVVSTQLVLN